MSKSLLSTAGKENDVQTVLNDGCLRWFGYNQDITKHLIEYVPHPRTLYNLSMTSKVLRSLVTTKVVVTCSMYYGGRPFSTIFKLARMMKLKAIYPPDALRINRLVNGRICEFCFNVRVDEKDNRNSLISDFGCPNSRPVEMRGRYPVFACITCLTRLRNRSISKDWAYPCLTRRWEKSRLETNSQRLNNVHKTAILAKPQIVLGYTGR